MCDSVSTCVPQIEGMRYSHTMITYVEGIGFGSSNSKVSLTLLHTLCIFFYYFYFNYTGWLMLFFNYKYLLSIIY